MIAQTVIKADGRVEPFSMEKLKRSMRRSEVDARYAGDLAQEINQKLPQMTSTDEIRKMVKKNLSRYGHYNEARYSARESIMKLGPSGYPFEEFVGQIFEAMGLRASQGVIVRGECVTHEVDVMAVSEEKVDLAECKFHNSFGTKSDIKIALYVWARSQDIKSAWPRYGLQGKQMNNYWLITNTKLTDDAMTYALCKQMNVMSWNYPEKSSLSMLIDKYSLYPVTVLKRTKSHLVTALVERGIVTLKQFVNINRNSLVDLNAHDVDAALYEANEILIAGEGPII